MTIETGPLLAPASLADHLEQFRSDDPDYRLLEVNIQEESYESAHIPGAVSIDWHRDLRDTNTFDVLAPDQFADLLGSHGITQETTVVVYGDFFNWFAAHAFWLLRYYGHSNVMLLDGGRKYWLAQGYPTTTAVPEFPAVEYETPSPDGSIRARRHEVEAAMESDTCLIDVRAPAEYRGELLAPPGWNEGVQRGGHIPTAVNKPCRCTMNTDRRFRSRAALEETFGSLAESDGVIVYCRIGERSALVWFVLSELLGWDDVAYYYGSFVEWGNTVGLPVEAASSADLR